MAPGGGATLRDLLDELGEQRKVFVCLDEAEPARMSRLCVVESRDVRTLGYILGLRTALGSCKAVVAGFKAWAEKVR